MPRDESDSAFDEQVAQIHARYQDKMVMLGILALVVYFSLAGVLRIKAFAAPGDLPLWLRLLVVAVIVGELIRWFVIDGQWLRSMLRRDAEREHMTASERREHYGKEIMESALRQKKALRLHIRLRSFAWMLPRVTSALYLAVLAIGYSMEYGPLLGVGGAAAAGLLLLAASEVHDRVSAAGVYSNAFAHSRAPRDIPEI